jgi:hypothetical protein
MNEDKKLDESKLKNIEEEFRNGIEAVRKFNPSVTFYGSTHLRKDNPYYKKVFELSKLIAQELKYNILTGGGPGIMEAANQGGYEAGVKSVGLTIKLPGEQVKNPYVTDEIPFNFFFSRQSSMSYSTEACIFCPGGFGTLSELFEVLTLRQTKKIGPVPVILFDSEYWAPFDVLIEDILLKKFGTVSPENISIYMIKDDPKEILEIIKNSKYRNGQDVFL